MAELLRRIGSEELAEWIAELGVLRPEDEKKAMSEAEGKASRQSMTLG